jgi:hypothetical protein
LFQPTLKRDSCSISNVKAFAIVAIFPGFEPTRKSVCVIAEAELIVSNVSISQTQGHARVVSPPTNVQLEGATAYHVLDVVLVPRQEFEGRANCIAHSQSKQATFGTIQRLIVGQSASP